jgi:hypothetical protein
MMWQQCAGVVDYYYRLQRLQWVARSCVQTLHPHLLGCGCAGIVISTHTLVGVGKQEITHTHTTVVEGER